MTQTTSLYDRFIDRIDSLAGEEMMRSAWTVSILARLAISPLRKLVTSEPDPFATTKAITMGPYEFFDYLGKQ